MKFRLLLPDLLHFPLPDYFLGFTETKVWLVLYVTLRDVSVHHPKVFAFPLGQSMTEKEVQTGAHTALAVALIYSGAIGVGDLVD